MNDMTDSAAGIVAEAAPLVKKTCTKCGVEKVLEEFHQKKGGKFGRSGQCKVCAYAYFRDYCQRPEVKERQRAYMRAYMRNYVRDRLLTDPAFKLVYNLRTRVHLALKGTRKSARTLELLGCTVEELRAHLESQFKPGMTWGNQGYRGWHIDHIRPCASFDLTDPEQQRACFHYTNLQPLWAEENMQKGAKFSLSPQAPDATVPPCSPPSSPHYASNGDTDLGVICSTERTECS
jgi:hypothetical protein